MAVEDQLERLGGSSGDSEGELPLGTTLLSGIVAALVISPVLWLILRTLDIGLSRAVSLLTRPSTLQIVGNSLLLVATVTFASVLIGVPLAVLTVQTDLPFRRFWTVAVALPLVVPSYIGAFAFVSAFGPHGELAKLLAPLGIESLPTIYGFGGAALVLTLFVYPYVFLTTRASLLSFDVTLIEAARSLDHSYWAAFRRVAIPQITPGITAGALLVALYALSDFGTPAIMHYDVFTRMIYVEYSTPGGGDFAALLSLQLLVITVVVLAIESRIGVDDRGAYASRGARETTAVSLGWLKGPALLFCTGVVMLCLIVPVGILFMWLLRGGPGYSAGGFAFQWEYGLNSVYAAGLAALVTVLAAIPIAHLSARSRSRLAGLFERATYLGYAAPGVVLGLALVYFGTTYAPILYHTLPLLIFAYVVRFLPQAVGSTRSSVLQVDPKLTEAARTLGESSTGAFRRVTLPLIMPGVVAGGALVFLTTMKELPATLLLHPTGFTTLVTYIWQVTDAGYYGQAALPALVLVGVSGLSMLVILAREDNDAR